MVPSISWTDFGSHKCRVWDGRTACGLAAHSQEWQLLRVSVLDAISSSLSYQLFSSCLCIFLLFALATLVLSFLSTPNSPATLYLATTFVNGLFAGSLMNYTLSHLLHLTNPHMHYIVSALVAMSRGFAGSFGSAVGGGFFIRILKDSLESGFSQHGLPPQPDLLRKLLGSPATVMYLTGPERVVAVQSYEHAVRMLFLAGSALALVATAFQAGTGWQPDVDDKIQEEWIDEEESLNGETQY